MEIYAIKCCLQAVLWGEGGKAVEYIQLANKKNDIRHLAEEIRTKKDTVGIQMFEKVN